MKERDFGVWVEKKRERKWRKVESWWLWRLEEMVGRVEEGGFVFFFLIIFLFKFFINCLATWHKCGSHVSINGDPIFATSSLNGLVNRFSNGCMKLK